MTDNSMMDANALNDRGMMHFQDGEFVLAAKCFEDAALITESTPDTPVKSSILKTLLGNLIEVAKQTSDEVIAFKAIKRLLELFPENDDLKLLEYSFCKIALPAEAKSFEERSNYYVTCHARPAYANSYGLQPDCDPGVKVAIVLQGPLHDKKDFTLETVKLYKRIFPFTTIIISTWEDESLTKVEALRHAGASVLLNAKPDSPGVWNINMQLCSAKAGILAAKQSGCEYVLKSRTDHRIYNQRFFIHALDLLSQFPLKESIDGNQKQRLLTFDDINLYRMYMLHDRNMFGSTNDLENYWTAPYDLRSGPEGIDSPFELAKYGLVESYLFCKYMEFLNRPLHWTLDDYWEILSERFIFMDHSAADLYWYKHEPHVEYRMRQYAIDSNFANLGFHEWLRIFQGKRPFVSDMRIAQRISGNAIGDILKEHSKPC